MVSYSRFVGCPSGGGDEGRGDGGGGGGGDGDGDGGGGGCGADGGECRDADETGGGNPNEMSAAQIIPALRYCPTTSVGSRRETLS